MWHIYMYACVLDRPGETSIRVMEAFGCPTYPLPMSTLFQNICPFIISDNILWCRWYANHWLMHFMYCFLSFSGQFLLLQKKIYASSPALRTDTVILLCWCVSDALVYAIQEMLKRSRIAVSFVQIIPTLRLRLLSWQLLDHFLSPLEPFQDYFVQEELFQSYLWLWQLLWLHDVLA